MTHYDYDHSLNWDQVSGINHHSKEAFVPRSMYSEISYDQQLAGTKQRQIIFHWITEV